MKAKEEKDINKLEMFEEFIKIHDDCQIYKFDLIEDELNQKFDLKKNLISFSEIAQQLKNDFKEDTNNKNQQLEQIISNDISSLKQQQWYEGLDVRDQFTTLIKDKFMCEQMLKNKNTKNLETHHNEFNFYDNHFEIFTPFAKFNLQNINHNAIQYSQLFLPQIIFNLGPQSIDYVVINSDNTKKLMESFQIENLKDLENSLIQIDIEMLKLNQITYEEKKIYPNDYQIIENEFYFQGSNSNSITIHYNYYPGKLEILKNIWEFYQSNKNYFEYQLPLQRIFWDIYIHSNNIKFRYDLELFLKSKEKEQDKTLSNIKKKQGKYIDIRQMTTKNYYCSECRSEIIKYFHFQRKGKIRKCLDCLLKHVNEIYKENQEKEGKKRKKISQVKQIMRLDFKSQCDQLNCKRLKDCKCFSLNYFNFEENKSKLEFKEELYSNTIQSTKLKVGCKNLNKLKKFYYKYKKLHQIE